MTKWQKTALVAVGFKSDKDEADEQTDKRGKDGERGREREGGRCWGGGRDQ